MNPGFFEGFEGRCLSMCEPGLDTAFGENPAPLASPDQQEFDLAATHPVTDRGHLFALAKFAQFSQAHKLGR